MSEKDKTTIQFKIDTKLYNLITNNAKFEECKRNDLIEEYLKKPVIEHSKRIFKKMKQMDNWHEKRDNYDIVLWKFRCENAYNTIKSLVQLKNNSQITKED